MRSLSFFLPVILFFSLQIQTSCKSADDSESSVSESDSSEDERVITNASKEEGSESDSTSKGEQKVVVVTLRNGASFQGSVPNQLLTDVLVAMEELVQKNPKDLGIMTTYLGLLRMHGQGGQVYDSVARKAGPLGSDNPWFLLEVGYGALARKDFGLAEYLFGKAEKNAKGLAGVSAAVRHAIGVSYLLQDKVQQGVYEMKQAAGGQNPYLPALLSLGYMGLRYGDYTGAERSFRAAMAVASKNLNSRMGLAIALRVKGNATEALEIMQSIYNEEKTDRRVVWNYALTLADIAGKEKEALSVLEKYFQLPGGFPELDAKATQLLNVLQSKVKS